MDVRSPDGSLECAEIELRRDSDCRVRIILNGESYEAVDSDFFTSFQQARAPFEAAGSRFLCYGASLGVWPSGMARDMGAGLKAYRLREDRPPTMEDLVDIFGSGDDVRPCTVGEQSAFADRWVRDAARRSRGG